MTATESRARVAVLLLTVVVGATALVMVEGFAIASPERAGSVGVACAALANVRRLHTPPVRVDQTGPVPVQVV
jgi:hypothetical protein